MQVAVTLHLTYISTNPIKASSPGTHSGSVQQHHRYSACLDAVHGHDLSIYTFTYKM